MTILCRRCHRYVAPVLRRQGPHMGAYCPECDAHIKWLPQTPELRQSVPDEPPAPQQGDLFGAPKR